MIREKKRIWLNLQGKGYLQMSPFNMTAFAFVHYGHLEGKSRYT